MKTETIIGFILSILGLAFSTLESSAVLLGIEQQTILIIALILGFLTSAWEMFQRLPKNEAEKQAKSFARYYKLDSNALSRKSEDIDDSYKEWAKK